jgi:hypothetical protein
MLSRRALEDVEIGGVKIRANDNIIGFLPAGDRDPSVFPDPDRLDVARKGAKNLAFGHGIHYCIGAALARLEAQVALTELIGRLRGLRLLFESPQWIPSIAIRGLAGAPGKPPATHAGTEEAASRGGRCSTGLAPACRRRLGIPQRRCAAPPRRSLRKRCSRCR